MIGEDAYGFGRGDIVSRTGGADRHKVEEVFAGWNLMRVRCIEPGPSGAWVVDDIEDNLCTRYRLIKRNWRDIPRRIFNRIRGPS